MQTFFIILHILVNWGVSVEKIYNFIQDNLYFLWKCSIMMVCIFQLVYPRYIVLPNWIPYLLMSVVISMASYPRFIYYAVRSKSKPVARWSRIIIQTYEAKIEYILVFCHLSDPKFQPPTLNDFLAFSQKKFWFRWKHYYNGKCWIFFLKRHEELEIFNFFL